MNAINVESFKRVNNDVNGNPRHVCHYLNFITDADSYTDDRYKLALKRAKKLGGKKFHNKQYGGGVVFQSYNIQDTCDRINELMYSIENPPAKVVKYPHPFFQYLVDNLKESSDILLEYGENVEDTIEARLAWTLARFNAEYCYKENLIRYGNTVNVFREWLMGLPSAFSVDFENYRILEIAKKWGSLKENASEKEEDKVIDNWFNFTAVKFFQLCKKHGVK